MEYFAYAHGDVMTSPKLEMLLGGPPRQPEAELGEREMDIAASIQAVTEEIVLRIARHARELTACSKLVMAGGVALNCVANGRLLREGPFDDIWIQPAAGDAGGALGAALFVWHQLLEKPRESTGSDAQRGSLLGPSYSLDEIESFLDGVGARYELHDSEDELADAVARLLAQGKVVGHLAGRMEFGPRALGARSILADPRAPAMQSLLNLKIKFRESFRPFAPAVLREHAHEYFELEPGQESPYMLLVAGVRAAHRAAEGEPPGQGFERLKRRRSTVSAITHVDYSARIQTVDEQRFPRLHRIVSAFFAQSGCPMLINTSFNVRGEPIVNTPAEAHRCFLATDMDALVLERCVLLKAEQPASSAPDRRAHLARFALD
jgi:carbamoyltransferase